VAILEDTGVILSAVAVSRGPDGSVETLAAFGDADASGSDVSESLVAIGTARGRTVEVRVRRTPSRCCSARSATSSARMPNVRSGSRCGRSRRRRRTTTRRSCSGGWAK
jgi:hypothetical protein